MHKRIEAIKGMKNKGKTTNKYLHKSGRKGSNHLKYTAIQETIQVSTVLFNVMIIFQLFPVLRLGEDLSIF